MSNKTICSAFWKHANIRSDNRVFPCCRFKYPVGKFNGDVGEILHTPAYQELRRKALAGEEIAGCKKCYDEEKVSGATKPNRTKEILAPSTRLEFNSTYNCKDVNLEFLEVGFDNICNLMCVMCSPEWSNAWGKKLHPDLPPKQLIKETDSFDNIPDTITTVLFLGGEPLMTTRHIKFMEKFKNLHQLKVIYNTNGTYKINNKVKKLLDKCKDVFFYISVDGIGEVNDRVREGSKWEDVTYFINQVKQYGYKYQITSSIHNENIRDLPNLYNWVIENDHDWRVTLVTYPEKFQIRNSTLNTKKKIQKFLLNNDVPLKKNILESLDI